MSDEPHDLTGYAELDDPGDGDTPLKPFALFLQEARKGGLHTEMSEETANLTKRVVETGKAGSITLTLTIKPHGADGMVSVADKVVVKTPRPEVGATYFFADEHGNLQRNPPNQQTLPLREIDGGRDKPLHELDEPRAIRQETTP